MIRNILALILLFLTFTSFGQFGMTAENCDRCPDGSSTTVFATFDSEEGDKLDIKIYPNPTTDYINFDNESGKVERVIIYSLVGRKVKEYKANDGKNTYDVTDLSNGMYLIQLTGADNKVIKTQRINKR